MNAHDWALAVLAILTLGALAYAVLRLVDERDAKKAYRQRMIDDARWGELMRAVTRARHDIDSGRR